MKISVVTIIKNRKSYVNKFITNVVEQSMPDYEHIVIDGASTDGTIEELKKHKNIILESKPDKGSVFALNTGLKLVSGDIFCWLNSDERYASGVLNLVCKEFTNNPQIDVISGGYSIIDTNGKVLRKCAGRNFSAKNRMIGFNSLVPSCVFIRTAALKKVGFYVDENLSHCYDHELYTRLRMQCNWKHLSLPLSFFEVHRGSGIISNPELAIDENKELRKKYKDKFNHIDFLVRSCILDSYTMIYRLIRWSRIQQKACSNISR
jgi:glycosyltransferase involved in cell wall biosynthesis